MLRHIGLSVLLLALAAAGAASQSPFDAASDFGSTTRDATCLAVADIDADGHLDVVLGESGGASLWLNDGLGGLTQSVWWPKDSRGFPLTDEVLSVAVGDIDRDGYIDVVLGTTLWLRVFMNAGGTLPDRALPDAILTSLGATGLGLGDTDGDGHLDLVIANGLNRAAANQVLKNNGGVFSSAWTQSDAPRRSAGVALGDVNGDGLVDAVFGNQDGPNRLYLGHTTGLLETTPAWEDTDALPTKAVALGDISGDGLFDLVCGNGTRGATLYLGDGAAFTTTADWASSTAVTGARNSVAIGDVDLDGDLDVAFGLPVANQVYLNSGATLDSLPGWQADDELKTRGVALADLNGDGDLELVGAGDRVVNPEPPPPLLFRSGQLYENITPLYPDVPDWETTSIRDATDVELVDVNLDGYLDLFVAHSHRTPGNGDASVIYEFNGVDYGAAPVWQNRIDPQQGTYPAVGDAAFGDMDGDGDPDLFMAATPLFGSYLYRNEAGSFPDTPLESAGFSGNLATWGDFARDGFPDLVVSTNGTGDRGHDSRFPNTSGVPDWTPHLFAPCLVGHAMFVVDVNDDGDDDLVYAGSQARFADPTSTCSITNPINGLFVFETANNTLSDNYREYEAVGIGVDGATAGYFNDDPYIDVVLVGNGAPVLMVNNGGRFEQDAGWVPAVVGHYDAQSGDIDGNGFSDVIATLPESSAGRSRIDVFLSENGQLVVSPRSIVVSGTYVRELAAGDIDGDGDVDLVAAEADGAYSPGGITRMYLARRMPVFKGEFAAPTAQLPANAVVIRDVEITPAGDNAYDVTFVLHDVESDPARVTFEYQYEGEGRWRPMQVGSPGATFASSPGGTLHMLTWDVIEIEFTSRPIVVRLQATDVGGTLGASTQHVSRFISIVGQVEPRRPSIKIVSPQAMFSTVTVGDTTCTGVVVRNIGNEPLNINTVDLPSPEMALLTDVPLSLAKGERDTLQICFQPTVAFTSPTDIIVHSNDPTRAAEPVPVTVDVRTLDATTEMFASPGPIPIDRDVSVVVTPAPGIRVEQGYLLHRAVGDAAFQDSIPLDPLGTEFIAVIPAAALAETGLEYYIRLENSGVHGFDPPGAPAAWFSQEVGPPTQLTAVATPNLGQGFAAGEPVEIRAVLPEGSQFERGWIYYRAGATADYDTTALTGEGFSARGEIPASATGVRGVDYWIEVVTATTRLADPAISPSSAPHHLRVTLSNLQEPSSHPGRKLRMFSFPVAVEGTLLGAIVDDVGGTGITRSRVFAWRGGPEYVEGDAIGVAGHGSAYWLVTAESHRLDTAPATSVTTDMSAPFEVRLTPGWNMVGQPYPFDVSWDAVAREDTMAVLGPPQRFTGSMSDPYDDARVLEPFSGYWVHNDADSVVRIWIPPAENTPSPTPPAVLDWSARVTASGEDAGTQSLILGTSANARNTRDRLDRLLPPAAPGQPMEIYAIDGGGRSYSADVRASTRTPGWGHAWTFDVAVSASGRVPVTLSFEPDALPDGAGMLLLDRELKRAHDPGSASHIEVFVTGSVRGTSTDDARFVLLVGDAQYLEEQRRLLPALPARTALHQNFPNPFNPTTVIRYELADNAHVSLRIYDVRGALVRTLEEHTLPAGRYEVGWDGTDNHGSSVASGVYFYRLVSSDGFSLVRKMVLLK